MLKGLFGNANIERVLLFLFVNDRCYASQIQSLLNVPLTPLQKAFERLEKEGIIESHHEGKTKIYELAPLYPFRDELEMLLKKAYTLLPAQEKKGYCFIHKPRLSLQKEIGRNRDVKKTLLAFWEKLGKIEHLSLIVKSKINPIKLGKASVEIERVSDSVMIFDEKGNWFSNQQEIGAFSNAFRWTLDIKTGLIALEHLRYSRSNPVFLLHLTPTGDQTLESVDAHLCAEDVYLGRISWNSKGIYFHWRIMGPIKNDHLTYHYS